MKKLGKLLAAILFGAACGGGIYYFQKYMKEVDKDECMDGFEDDFDEIDEEGNVAEDRSYVNLELDKVVTNLEVETEEFFADDEE